MASSRSSNARLLAIGFAVLVIGVLLVLIIVRNTDDPAATPAPTATQGQQDDGDESSDDSTQMSPEQLSTARLPLPLDVADGHEAIAVRANFMRSVAAIPAPGDLVSLYRLPAAVAADDEDDTQAPSTTLPEAGPDAEQVVAEVEVLAVTGPLPSSNDGTITLVVAVPTGDVPGVMPVANASEVWFTLLPSPEDEATEQATEEGTEDAA